MEITIIKIVLAAIFALAVAGKLTGKTRSTFENAGFSPAVLYATAFSEIVFTIGLFTGYELFSALGLLAIIGGAFISLILQKAKSCRINYEALIVNWKLEIWGHS